MNICQVLGIEQGTCQCSVNNVGGKMFSGFLTSYLPCAGSNLDDFNAPLWYGSTVSAKNREKYGHNKTLESDLK